jgi:hypothetical protein
MTTAYVTYTYYTTTYLGVAIASADFARYALRASAVIDRLTFDRAALETDLATVDKIKMATCAVAEELQAEDLSGGADGIQSESVGASSVSYSVGSGKLLTNETKQSKAAKLYLASTGLMFKGFASGEYSGDADAD